MTHEDMLRWLKLSFWCGALILIIVSVGLMLGHVPPPHRPTLQQQLDHLEQRVRILEQREEQP